MTLALGLMVSNRSRSGLSVIMCYNTLKKHSDWVNERSQTHNMLRTSHNNRRTLKSTIKNIGALTVCL